MAARRSRDGMAMTGSRASKNRIIEQESSMTTGSTILGLGPTVDMVGDDRKAQGFLVGCISKRHLGSCVSGSVKWAQRPRHGHEKCLVDSECGMT